METLLTKQAGLTALILVLGTSASLQASAASHKPSPPHAVAVPEWSPVPALVATLGPEVAVGRYRMHLPAGYTAEVKKEQANPEFKMTIYSLHGADDFEPTMYAMRVSLRQGQAQPTPLQLMAGDGVMHSAAGKELTSSPVERGKIHGIPAFRQYFKKVAHGDGHIEHGFHYVIADGAERTIIIVLDDEPRSKTSVPLAEAAVLTLRQ